MLNHKFLQVLKYEGVVSITSWTELAPAAGMTHLEMISIIILKLL